MFLIRRPSPRLIDRFLKDSARLPISYGPVGQVQSGHVRSLDEATVVIGHGRADFDRARQALSEWKQFDLGWVELFPRHSPLEVGTVVAVAIKHLGFWSLNGCRVVYHADSNGADAFGYAYGTLPNHAESGEELFEVYIDPRTDDVIYRIRATSKPQSMLAWLGQPIVR
ncbi:MAG TPA: DUF1990 domain-containing protein, partial [Vicinamibacterales bacterium]|nr:DUF1990 domain-containing protein [Vicinamibacterales bacterium]